MSTQPVQAPVAEATTPKETPELTDSYRKAHKNYVLVAGLLASWELIGVDLHPLQEKWGVVLKSPSGVPLILFTVLLYSAYKVAVEWVQCDPTRRRNRAARLDYRFSHVVALTVVSIGLFQYLGHFRIADLLVSRGGNLALGLFLFTGVLIVAGVQVVHVLKERDDYFFRIDLVGSLVFCLIAGFAVWVSWRGVSSYVARILAVGGGTTAGIIILLIRWKLGPKLRELAEQD